MTTTRSIGGASPFDATGEGRSRRDQRQRGAGAEVKTAVGGDRSHGGAQGNTRDTATQARAFQAALAQGSARKAAPPSPPSLPATHRPSPFSGPLSPGRDDVRRGGASDSPLQGLPRYGGADRNATGGHRDSWQRGAADDAHAMDDANDGSGDDLLQRRSDALSDPAAEAEDGVAHGDVERDSDAGEDRGVDNDASGESVDIGEGEADTGWFGEMGSSSTLRDAGVPPNARHGTDADRREGHDGGDRNSFARHTQDAMLAALARPLSRPYGGPLPGASKGSTETRGLALASPLLPVANTNAQDAADKAVLRSMLDAIDALRVDVDGRRGVEMDVSVPGTQGVTVRVEEAEGCLQTTVSCREAADARRLQVGVQALADHLAKRFVRAARVRIETSDAGGGASSQVSSPVSSHISDAHAADTVPRRAPAYPGARATAADHDLVAEAYAPLPSAESI